MSFRTSADAYDRHIGRYGPSLAAALLDFAAVEPGMRTVDVGCGPGALTAALVERLGAENVAGADPSEPYAEACHERLGVEVAVSPAESLPFPDDSFDAALSQLAINFMTDPQAGVRQMARVTRPGGTVAGCVWDYAGEMTLLRAFWDAAHEVDPTGAADADEADMPCSAEGELTELWRKAGLDDVRPGSLLARASYESFDDLWAPFEGGVGPTGAYLAALDEDRRTALRDALRRRLDTGDDPFELTARAWAAYGSTR